MLDRVQESELTKTTKSFAISVVTKVPAMQIQYVGPFLFASVAVAAGGDMTFKADDTDGLTTVDPDIGFTTVPTALGVIDLSTPATAMNTMAKLRNHINGMANWRCFLVGVLPTTPTDNNFDTLAEASGGTVRSENGLTLFLDEATAPLDGGFAISNQMFTSRPSGGRKSNRANFLTDVNCINQLNFLSVNITSVGASNIEIYWVDDDDDTTGLMWQQVTVSATLETHGTDPGLAFLVAPIGKRLLVFFDNAAAVTACDVTAVFETKNMVGSRVAGPGAYTGA